jgi:hypothetical protein
LHALAATQQPFGRAQLRITTLLVVDALKSITYAFLLGQRVAHQPGDAWLDAAVTLATTVAAPELVMSCLEARARSVLCRAAARGARACAWARSWAPLTCKTACTLS